MQPQQTKLTVERQKDLLDELRHACQQTPRDEINAWARKAALRFPAVTIRRAKNFAYLVVGIGSGTVEETRLAIEKIKAGEGAAYSKDLAKRAADNTVGFMLGMKAVGVRVYDALRTEPAEAGPKLLIWALAAATTSGGFDADGGAPDMDLLGGIGEHRSPLTHSILMGALIETLLLGLADLVALTHRYLKPGHDKLWDSIAEHTDAFIDAAHRGSSAGIAYHLGVDGLIQEGTLHDLPEMPQEGHDAVLTIQAVTEAADASKREKPTPRTKVPSAEQVRDAATQAKQRVGIAASQAYEFTSNLLGDWLKRPGKP